MPVFPIIVGGGGGGSGGSGIVALPTGVTGGAGTDGNPLLTLQAQGSSGEFRSLLNINGDEVIAENTDGNEQGQFILKNKTGPVMFAATADQGILLGEYAAAPGTPATGRVAVYPKADGRLYAKDDGGTELPLASRRQEVKTSVTGALTTDSHSGHVLVTSGNVTVPNAAGDVGFTAVIVAGGAHTVTFNSTTSAAMSAGDVMTVVVQSATVIKAVLTEAADLVTFS